MVALGALFLKIVPVGLGKSMSQLGALSGQFNKLKSTMAPGLEEMSASFKKFGVLSAAAFGALLLASPRLRAEMSILAIRIRELIRPVGDTLAPAIRVITNLIVDLTKAFQALPEPVQRIILFATAFVVAAGLVIGVLAILPVLFNPVTIAIVTIGLALAIMAELWTSNWLNIQVITEAVIGQIIEIIGGLVLLVTGIPNIFLGMMTDIVTHIIEAGLLIGVAVRDLFIKPLLGFLTFAVDFGGKLFGAGQELIAAFFRGAQQAMAGAGGLLTDVLDFVFGFFGGSLPERGPLVGIPRAGQELGEAYTAGISSGVDSTVISESFTRVFNIGNVNVSMPMAGNDPRQFGERLETGVRRSTSW